MTKASTGRAHSAKKVLVMGAACVTALGILGGVHAAAADDSDFTVTRKYSYGSYTVAVTSYNGKGGDVTLPAEAEIGGQTYTITKVGSDVFKNFKDTEFITSVTVPEGYTQIEGEAFAQMDGLTKVSLPGSLTNVSYSAFKDSAKLSDVTFATPADGTKLSFGNNIFQNCTSLTSIALPKSLNSLNNNPFLGCTNLDSITVADGNDQYFAENNLVYGKLDDGNSVELAVYPPSSTATEFTVPETVNNMTVTQIGMHAFRYNDKLTSVTIPATVNSFRTMCFDNCSNLKTVTLGTTEAPKFGSSSFTNLAAGSTIYVANDTVKKAFEPTDSWTNYYTADNTTVTVQGDTDIPAVENKVSASMSLEADGVSDKGAAYKLYLEKAQNVGTIMFKLSFDRSQFGTVNASAIEALEGFTKIVDVQDGGVVVTLARTDKSTLTAEGKTCVANITLPVADGVTGELAATVEKAEIAGYAQGAASIQGELTLANAAASNWIANYDVNSDSKVNIVDITEAQRFYQAAKSDADWADSRKADVNGDGKVDIQDLIDIFHSIVF